MDTCNHSYGLNLQKRKKNPEMAPLLLIPEKMPTLRLTDKAEGVENLNNKQRECNKISHDIVWLAFRKGNAVNKQ